LFLEGGSMEIAMTLILLAALVVPAAMAVRIRLRRGRRD
jgi:hypothetical protein